MAYHHFYLAYLMNRTWHLVLVLLLQHAPTIEDSQLCFVRCDAVEEEDTMCLWMGHP